MVIFQKLTKNKKNILKFLRLLQYDEIDDFSLFFWVCVFFCFFFRIKLPVRGTDRIARQEFHGLTKMTDGHTDRHLLVDFV